MHIIHVGTINNSCHKSATYFVYQRLHYFHLSIVYFHFIVIMHCMACFIFNCCLIFHCYETLNKIYFIFKIYLIMYQMETFSALLAICAGNSPVPGEFPAQRPVTQSFDVFFDLHLNKRLSNNREAGDLRRYRAHYDVIVMWQHRPCLIRPKLKPVSKSVAFV